MAGLAVCNLHRIGQKTIVTSLPAGPDCSGHQILLFITGKGSNRGNLIAVGCTCLGRYGNGRGRPYLDARALFPAAGAVACWRDWHAERGVIV